jgi:ACS family glucarate transporter-like MFS transporter
VNWLPTYFIQRYGLPILSLGFYATLPYVVNWGTAILSGWGSSFLLHRGFSLTVSRKSFIYVGSLGYVVFTFLLLYAGEPLQALVFAMLALGSLGLVGPIFFTLPLDLNPSSAGRITGLMMFGSALSSFMAPALTGYIVEILGWDSALALSALSAFSCFLISRTI